MKDFSCVKYELLWFLFMQVSLYLLLMCIVYHNYGTINGMKSTCTLVATYDYLLNLQKGWVYSDLVLAYLAVYNT